MKKQNWDEIKEADQFDNPEPGGYIARITRVEDVEEKEYLRIEWDFAEGRYKDNNAETYDRAGFWPITLIRSYKPKALGFFKAFKTALEVSNRGFCFDEDHLQNMVGKVFGVVLGEEEYRKNNGEIGKRLYVSATRSIKAIESGDFKIPELKRVADDHIPNQAAGVSEFTELTDDDGELPF